LPDTRTARTCPLVIHVVSGIGCNAANAGVAVKRERLTVDMTKASDTANRTRTFIDLLLSAGGAGMTLSAHVLDRRTLSPDHSCGIVR
jgi:hypothetical protein